MIMNVSYNGRIMLMITYSIPQCAFNTWSVAVGDKNYAVLRLLEIKFAKSNDIISTPDINLNAIIISSEGGAKLIFESFWFRGSSKINDLI